MTRSVFNHRRGSGSGNLLTSDTFDRANGVIGSTNGTGLLDPVAWTTNIGTWNVLSNLGRTSALGTDPWTGLGATATIDHKTADVDLTVTITTPDTNGQGIIFRLTDTSNFLVMLGDTTKCQLLKIASASQTVLISSFGTLASGTVMRVLCYGTTIKVYLNGTQVGSTTNTFNQTATIHGMRSQSTGQRFNNWLAYQS